MDGKYPDRSSMLQAPMSTHLSQSTHMSQPESNKVIELDDLIWDASPKGSAAVLAFMHDKTKTIPKLVDADKHCRSPHFWELLKEHIAIEDAKKIRDEVCNMVRDVFIAKGLSTDSAADLARTNWRHCVLEALIKPDNDLYTNVLRMIEARIATITEKSA